jgi:hypothetical protein
MLLRRAASGRCFSCRRRRATETGAPLCNRSFGRLFGNTNESAAASIEERGRAFLL